MFLSVFFFNDEITKPVLLLKSNDDNCFPQRSEIYFLSKFNILFSRIFLLNPSTFLGFSTWIWSPFVNWKNSRYVLFFEFLGVPTNSRWKVFSNWKIWKFDEYFWIYFFVGSGTCCDTQYFSKMMRYIPPQAESKYVDWFSNWNI